MGSQTPAVQQNSTPLVSIERVVAFVLGPAVVAGSGTLSAWLSTKVGIHISGPEIAGAFGTGAVAAGALAYKWLNGRQTAPILIHNVDGVATHVLNTVTNTIEELGIPRELQEGFAKTALDHAEIIAQKTADAVVAKIPQPGPITVHLPAQTPVEPIPPAEGDPAPVTPLAAAAAVPDAVERPQSAVTPDGGAPSPGIEQAPPPAQA